MMQARITPIIGKKVKNSSHTVATPQTARPKRPKINSVQIIAKQASKNLIIGNFNPFKYLANIFCEAQFYGDIIFALDFIMIDYYNVIRAEPIR